MPRLVMFLDNNNISVTCDEFNYCKIINTSSTVLPMKLGIFINQLFDVEKMNGVISFHSDCWNSVKDKMIKIVFNVESSYDFDEIVSTFNIICNKLNVSYTEDIKPLTGANVYTKYIMGHSNAICCKVTINILVNKYGFILTPFGEEVKKVYDRFLDPSIQSFLKDGENGDYAKYLYAHYQIDHLKYGKPFRPRYILKYTHPEIRSREGFTNKHLPLIRHIFKDHEKELQMIERDAIVQSLGDEING